MKPTMSVIFAFLFLHLLGIPTANFGFLEGSSPSHMGCIQSEREALLRFKQDLNDSSNWLASWTGDGDCCTWTGVVCDNFSGHVLELHLSDSPDFSYHVSLAKSDAYGRKELSGKLNPSLLNLERLIYLDLSRNGFDGIPIPKFFGSMRNLRYLNLSCSGFEGIIPQELGNLSNLQYLELGSNDLFVENFFWLSGLSLLRHLDLSSVDLSKASDWLSVSNTLPSLVVLQLPRCGLDHLPPLPVANFSSLTTLDLSFNDFNYSLIPRWVFGLSHLVFLDLSGAYFGGLILDGLQNLTSLRHFDLSRNNLGDSTSNNWCKFKNLEYLSLSMSDLQGAILDGLGNLTSIKVLDLSSNMLLEGTMPRSWGNFCKLSSLSLSYVNLSQEISEILDIFSGCVSKTLEHLDLSDSESFGSLTNQLGKFQNLRFLSLTDNSISGHIPSCLGEVSLLTHVALSNNMLNGFIPISTGNLSTLVSLDVSNNLLTGSIPSSLGKLSSLLSLDVSNNNLSESIPSSLGNLSSLVSLDFSNNSLSGSIPSSLGKLSSLESVDVSYNQLSGSLPSSLGMLSSLGSVDFSYNQLSGSLPSSLGMLSSLGSLNLRCNSLEGSIPLSIGNMSSLELVDVSYNQLSGFIPQSLGQLSSLDTLDLSFNKLNGSLLPNHFVHLAKLSKFHASGSSLMMKVHPNWVPPFKLLSLDLQSCHLGPKFPLWLLSQYSLQYLDISNAAIADTIPVKFWETATEFSFLNLSHNQIYGVIPNLSSSDQVTILDLSWNNLSCSSLRSSHLNVIGLLDLSNNLLSGSCLHHFLCYEDMNESKFLGILNLENNFLSRELPDCWRNWSSLEVLKINNNKFSGSIPTSFGSLSSLKSLQLHKNSFSGIIPVSLSNCSELVILDISENEFVGNIPQWIGERFSSLRILNFHSNKFCGPLPVGLCHLASLQVLDLAHNNLSGIIPRCINNFSGMMVMKDFESGSLQYKFHALYHGHGSFVEDELLLIKGKWNEYNTILNLVRCVDLSSNKFSGEIPIEVTYLRALQSLNLSYNHFIGRIPENIGVMRSLESIDFSENHLHGEIPQSISSLTFLSFLNLSNNNLTGKIPLSTQLQSFDPSSFVGNGLCGAPLPMNCTATIPTPNFDSGGGKDGNGHEVDWFYVSMGLGFMVGFWSIISPLIVNRRWRYKYYHFLDQLGDKFVCVVRKCC